METREPSPGPSAGSDLQASAIRLDRKPTIAVVDDDPSMLRALDRLLRLRGCQTKAFASPADFALSATAAPPDCLILDVRMPEMSGLELLTWLLKKGLHFPVIFVTASEDPRAEAQACRSGAAGFFHKPFDNDALWAAVVNALATR